VDLNLCLIYSAFGMLFVDLLGRCLLAKHENWLAEFAGLKAIQLIRINAKT